MKVVNVFAHEVVGSPEDCQPQNVSTDRWTEVNLLRVEMILSSPSCVESLLVYSQECSMFLVTADITPQTQDVDTMLFQCWTTVFDAGQTLKQHGPPSSTLAQH